MSFDIVKFLESQYGIFPKPRAEKVKALYDLARQRKQGCIVELGTYHGLGTAALCLGLQESGYSDMVSVYTVDDFIDRKGWAYEEYRPVDRMIFEQRMRNLGLDPVLISLSAREAGKNWNKPIGLLFWDTGAAGEMLDDVILWEKHFLVGGVMYLHDTGTRILGSQRVAEYFKDTWEVINDNPNTFLMRKLK